MNSILIFGLFTIVAAYVAAPLIKKRDGATLVKNDDGFDDLETDKNNLLATIRELEFDYDMGKLSAADFEQLERDYRNRAVALIQKIEEIKNREMDDIEDQIRAYRQKLAERMFCKICGAKSNTDDKFCSQCGSPLNSS